MVNSIGFSLLSASYAFSLCTLHFHFHFVLGFSIPGKLEALFGRGPILSAPTHSASQSGHFWTRSNSERSHFNLEMMMYACVRQLHGAYGAGRAQRPLVLVPDRRNGGRWDSARGGAVWHGLHDMT